MQRTKTALLALLGTTRKRVRKVASAGGDPALQTYEAVDYGLTALLRRAAEDALSHADLACNMAKQQGRNRAKLYNPADSDKAGMAATIFSARWRKR